MDSSERTSEDGTNERKRPSRDALRTGAARWRERVIADAQSADGREAARRHPFLKGLQVSSAHVYLTYPFVLSWSMLEAVSAGCVVSGSATAPAREVIEPDCNGMLVPFFAVDEFAERAVEVLQDPAMFACHKRADS
jgi:hypothetical protein